MDLRSDDDEGDDEFFGEQEEESPSDVCPDGHERHKGLMAAEAQAAEKRYRKLGYHEAYDAHKDDRIQEGFVDGYREAYANAIKIGEQLGKAVVESRHQTVIAPTIREFLTGNNRDLDGLMASLRESKEG